MSEPQWLEKPQLQKPQSFLLHGKATHSSPDPRQVRVPWGEGGTSLSMVVCLTSSVVGYLSISSRDISFRVSDCPHSTPCRHFISLLFCGAGDAGLHLARDQHLFDHHVASQPLCHGLPLTPGPVYY